MYFISQRKIVVKFNPREPLILSALPCGFRIWYNYKHVTRYLLEMGNGFTFVARQKHFQVGNSDFYADLILYSIPLHAYIVVELKGYPIQTGVCRATELLHQCGG